MEIRQYQIVVVNLDLTIGSEIRKTRPCVVISPDEMNRPLKTIVIAPVTSQSKKYPTRIEIYLAGNSNWIAVDQIRTIDKTRVIRTISVLPEKEIKLLKSKIKETYVE